MGHRNAPLAPEGRRRLCQRVDAGRPICHVASEAGQTCVTGGCLARRACPVGRAYIQTPAQAQFHMKAFLRAHGHRASDR